MVSDATLLSVLQERFGFKQFRPGQLEALRTLLQEGRLLCIQPTGHGKSLLYQLPASLLPGLTLVISPLLALMRDQMEHLKCRFQIPATSMNSDQSEEENAQAKESLARGDIKVLFISPEQLDHVDRFDFCLTLNISLIVIDEAHCISTWGHDFRPSYRQILHFIQAAQEKNQEIKILGLTATADDRVEKDIAKQLSSPKILRESMDRPNIHLSVFFIKGIAAKLLHTKTLLATLDGSGLIYCATRENTELVAEFLQMQGVNSIAYHAGLESDVKKTIQTAFAADSYKVVAATTALGMGIDKANLRFIIHFDIPGSITAYYQEVGRCGRDGLKAQGILLYDPEDRKIQDYFIDSALPLLEDFEHVLTAARTALEPPNLTHIKRATGLHPTRVLITVAELIEQGHLIKLSHKGSQVYKVTAHAAPLNLERYTIQHQVKRRELDKMLSYAEQTTDCRMATLRSALGDRQPLACSHCDVCCNAVQTHTSSPDSLSSSEQWLSSRPVPIAEARTYRLSSGISALDGKLRTPTFVRFMKERTQDTIDEELLHLLKTQVSALAALHTFGAIIPLPSTTWGSRETIAKALGMHLNAPVLLDLLTWIHPPDKRQGELLNNDQRHFNVAGKMQASPQVTLPAGTLLLLDDYIGCGATLKEAARALRQHVNHPLVPFTIASLKWRLGKPGFI